MLSDSPFQGPLSLDPVLVTKHPIAFESPDHLHPWGTARDNSRNPAFNAKVFNLFEPTVDRPLKVLDIGCSGGGFVKDMVDAGHVGVGLEGSDYSRRHKRAEWATIPGNLTTCDCSRPFDLLTRDGGERIQFDLITAWEVLEHLDEAGLDQLFRNLANHLDPERGLFIGSVAFNSSNEDGEELHQTIQPEAWWLRKIEDAGFRLLEPALLYFNVDWIRGPIQAALGSFHVVFGLPTNTLDAHLNALALREARPTYRSLYEFYEKYAEKCLALDKVGTAYLQAMEVAKQASRQNEALKKRFGPAAGTGPGAA